MFRFHIVGKKKVSCTLRNGVLPKIVYVSQTLFSWLRFLLRTEPALYCSITNKKKALYLAFGAFWSLWYAVLSYANHIVHSVHDIPIKEQIKTTVNVYSWEEKTEWRHSMYVSENSRWDFKAWPLSLSKSVLKSWLCFFRLARRTRHFTNSHFKLKSTTSMNFSNSIEN